MWNHQIVYDPVNKVTKHLTDYTGEATKIFGKLFQGEDLEALINGVIPIHKVQQSEKEIDDSVPRQPIEVPIALPRDKNPENDQYEKKELIYTFNSNFVY